MTRIAISLAAAIMIGIVAPAYADRNILTPTGFIMRSSSVRGEYLSALKGGGSAYFGFVSIGLPSDELGLELEGEEVRIGGRVRQTLHAQYSLTGNAFADLAPAVSVGVRDFLNQGREGLAPYVVATKQFGLSEKQERLFRDLRISLGVGARRMEGLFGGIQVRLPIGVTLGGEYAARRLNATAALGLGRNLKVGAYNVDGAMFYGATLTIRR